MDCSSLVKPSTTSSRGNILTGFSYLSELYFAVETTSSVQIRCDVSLSLTCWRTHAHPFDV